MKPEYTLELPRYSDEFVAELIVLASSVFTRAGPKYIRWRIANMPGLPSTAIPRSKPA